MPKWSFNGRLDDDYEFEDDFNVDESYTNQKKKSSVKHQKRPDKE